MPDFEDFILEGGWELLFGDDFECPACGKLIQKSDVVEKGKMICPNCGEKLKT